MYEEPKKLTPRLTQGRRHVYQKHETAYTYGFLCASREYSFFCKSFIFQFFRRPVHACMFVYIYVCICEYTLINTHAIYMQIWMYTWAYVRAYVYLPTEPRITAHLTALHHRTHTDAANLSYDAYTYVCGDTHIYVCVHGASPPTCSTFSCMHLGTYASAYTYTHDTYTFKSRWYACGVSHVLASCHSPYWFKAKKRR